MSVFWGILGLAVLCVVITLRSQRFAGSTVLGDLCSTDLMWCLMEFDEQTEGSTQGHSFLCSEAFKAFLRRDSVTWKNLMSCFGCEVDSPFQKGIRDLIQGATRFVEYDAIVYDQGIRVQMWMATAKDHRSSQGIFMTVQPRSLERDLQRDYAELKEEKNGLLALFNALPVPVWARNAAGKLTFCNQAYAKLLETQPHQVLLRQWELIDGDDAKAAHALYKEVLDDGGQHTFIAKRNHKGISKEFCITEAALPASLRRSNSPESAQLVGVAFDVSDQGEDLERRKQQMSAYQSVFQAADWPVCVLTPDARVVTFTQAFADVLELDPEWLAKGVSVVEILETLRERDQLPEYIEYAVIKARCQKWISDPSRAFRALWSFPSGKVFELSAEMGEHQMILVSLKNVSQVLGLEGRLKSLKSVWDFMVENANEALLIVGLDHRIQKASQNMQAFLGTQQAEFSGKFVKEVLAKISKRFAIPGVCSALEDALELRKPYQAKLATARGRLLCEYAPLPDGTHMLRFSSLGDTTDGGEEAKNLLLFERDDERTAERA